MSSTGRRLVARTQKWYQPDEHSGPVLPNLPSAPSGLDFGWDAQADRDTSQRWYQPDEQAFVQTVAAATFNPATSWVDAEERQQDAPISAVWDQRDPFGAEPATPPRNIPTIASQTYDHPYYARVIWTDPNGGSSALTGVEIWCNRDGLATFQTAVLLATVSPGVQFYNDYFGDLEDYPADKLQLRYWARGVNAEGLTGSPEWNTQGLNFSWPFPEQDPQQSPSNAQTWFAPEASVEGLTPPAAVFSPASGFPWQDEQQLPPTGQQWNQPEEQQSAVFPQFITTATTAQIMAAIQEQPEHPSTVQLWIAPPGAVGQGIGVEFDPSLSWVDAEERQQDRPVAVTWYVEPDPMLGDIPRASAATTTPTVEVNWDAQQDRSTAIVWFRPDDPPEGLPPLVNASSGLDFGWDAQADRDQAQRLYQPDEQASGFTPLVNAYAGSDIGDQPDLHRDQSQRWYEPEPFTGGDPPIPSAPSGLDFGRDQQQDSGNGQQWFRPDDAAEGLLPPGTVPDATVPQQAAAWAEQPQEWREAQRYQPDEQQAGFAPLAAAYAGMELVWDIQQDKGNGQQWYAPEASFDGFLTPPQVGADATDTQQDRSIQPVWFAPEAAVEPHITVTYATPAQQAGLFGWDGLFDRSTAQVWFRPDDDYSSFGVTIPRISSGTPPIIRGAYAMRPSGYVAALGMSGNAPALRPVITQATDQKPSISQPPEKPTIREAR